MRVRSKVTGIDYIVQRELPIDSYELTRCKDLMGPYYLPKSQFEVVE